MVEIAAHRPDINAIIPILYTSTPKLPQRAAKAKTNALTPRLPLTPVIILLLPASLHRTRTNSTRFLRSPH
jgi:hypothetical protein